MNAYYFDTLPAHVQPHRGESFTSYLTRLAEANGIQLVGQLFKMCFSKGRPGFTFRTGDFPPRSFGALPTMTMCSPSDLLPTTFYYLAQKFSRRTEAQPVSQFMSGTLSPGLRYCPDCLTERGYYALVWRFLDLEGCPEHGCRLLDHCQQCGQKIPLLTQPFKFGYCPICGNDLRRGQVEQLTPSARQTAQACYQDLVFLVSPLATEPAHRPLVKFIGEQFGRWRQVRRLKVVDAADYIEQSVSMIYFIERGSEARNAKLQWYLGYADFLKVRFQTMFEEPLPPQPERTEEDQLVEKVQQAIASLEQTGERVTQQAICHMIDVFPSRLNRYPQIKEMCVASQAKWDHHRETKLVEQVHQIAARVLAQTGQPCTQKEICRQLGWSVAGLNKYPRVRAALKQQVTEQMRNQHEEMLLQQVQAALTLLEETNQNVSQRAISQLVGVSIKTMDRYPKIRRFVVEQVFDRKPEHQLKQFQRREQELLAQVQQAIETLTFTGQPVTQAAIYNLVDLSKSALERYPRVQLLLKEAILPTFNASVD
jgi:transcriptional regulator with XRE-family HTH domain